MSEGCARAVDGLPRANPEEVRDQITDDEGGHHTVSAVPRKVCPKCRMRRSRSKEDQGA